MNRSEILDAAKEAVTKDRNATHGEPENIFREIAVLWGGELQVLEPHDVALHMILLKVARARLNPLNVDNWIDIAGYAACGGEVAK